MSMNLERWKGYSCLLCPSETSHRRSMEEHIEEHAEQIEERGYKPGSCYMDYWMTRS